MKIPIVGITAITKIIDKYAKMPPIISPFSVHKFAFALKKLATKISREHSKVTANSSPKNASFAILLT